jgi:hypothetical protein
MTGTIYSSGGKHAEPDRDLHFTLQLDPQDEKFSTSVILNVYHILQAHQHVRI